ncbi:MAG: hypothetical protein N3B13_09480, partial [Deltaproteobacteria bacterium]|nr:hypothetical protein [Deltaproteobacteria bacterium]
MKVFYFFLLLIFLSSCSDLTDSNNKLSQSEIDRYTGYAIIDAVTQLYNINFAGKPAGGQNLTTTCPDGGNVTITGSTGYSQNNNITTVDLSLKMSECQTSKHSQNNTDSSLKLTGTIIFKGSFNSSTG